MFLAVDIARNCDRSEKHRYHLSIVEITSTRPGIISMELWAIIMLFVVIAVLLAGYPVAFSLGAVAFLTKANLIPDQVLKEVEKVLSGTHKEKG